MKRLFHVVLGSVAALAAAEWLDGTAPVWAWLAAGAGVGTLALVVAPAVRARQRPAVASLAAGITAAALGVALLLGAATIRRIECCWPQLRESLLTRASAALGTTLRRTVAEARRVADRAAVAAALPAPLASTHVERALAQDAAEFERGVLIRDDSGDPWAWAGRHRFLPRPDTAELTATITPFYVALEARRQTPEGRSAVGHVLLDAGDEIPDRDHALGVAFARQHGVRLRFFAPGTAPPAPDVLDFCSGPCQPPPDSVRPADTLFSVLPVPPTQSEAKETTRARAAKVAVAALAALLVSLLFAAPAGAARWAVLAIGCWTLVRSAAGVAIEPPLLFSPGAFFRPGLGPFGASAGSLAALGALIVAASAALWERGLGRRWGLVAGAALLALAAPYLLRHFGRGITPPASGVGFALWLTWQMALATTSLALVLLGAALVRGEREPIRVPWTLPAACIWAVGAAVGGLWLWHPAGAWPDWYPLIWLPALAGILVPAPRRWVLVGSATVAGTAAALLTWGAAVEGRLSLAQRDVQRLGREGDNVAVAFLERLGEQATLAPPPVSAGQLYALWLHSPLAAGDYPTVLALWSNGGDLVADLRLAALDLPTRLLAELARSADPRGGVRVERLERMPGVHYVLVAPVAAGGVLTVGVGPRSQLVPPDRVARFLRGDVGREPPYTLTLSLPTTEGAVETRALAWARRGWVARGDRHVSFPDGIRHVHARVDLGGPLGLIARGTLVVAADLALLALLWWLGRFAALDWRPRSPPVVQVLRTSFRARLAAALAAFFVLPVLAFAVASFARLADETRRDSDLLIRQTLKDAEATAGAVAFERRAVTGSAVAHLGLRLDSELWLYREGVLEAVSAPVLAELGLVERLLTPLVYRRLVLEDDEIELTADALTAGRPVRVGYRVVRVDPLGRRAVLAAAQLLDDERVRREQEDLAVALAVATLAGLVAAITLAGVAARALSQPVAALREAALAVGRGAPPPPFQAGATHEFEPVFSAFERMAADVRESQEALEAARRRTAQVLANVATGVVAVDPALRVTTANPRAEELLRTSLTPGTWLSAAAPAAWAPVWEAVVAFLRRAPGAPEQIVEREFEIDGRQIRVQIAGLGTAGCVVALDDATELTRAARVLAWGEMARQVAHEIKNPLTPIRLGIQHLQRARRGAEFEATLDETSQRILEEIDRLDAIARAFSRFGAPAAEAPPLESVDVFRTASEVVQLYALGRPGISGDGGTRFEVEGASGALVRARQAELKEVLVNVLENARQAEAQQVVVRVTDDRLVVEDDGHGIPPDALSRVFEPTFSTTSSGSGLGLAIAKRLVESWGARIEIESRAGRGTKVIITFGPVAHPR
ncbi:MAG TPA: ATP-binding protein [Gemmatimonadales bacterium]